MKKILSLILIGLFLLSISFVSAHTGEDDYAHHSMMGGMMSGTYGGWFGMFFGWVFMVLIIVALVLLIVWLIKQVQKK